MHPEYVGKITSNDIEINLLYDAFKVCVVILNKINVCPFHSLLSQKMMFFPYLARLNQFFQDEPDLLELNHAWDNPSSLDFNVIVPV